MNVFSSAILEKRKSMSHFCGLLRKLELDSKMKTMTLDLKTSWYRVSFQVLCVGSSALLNQQNNDFNACKSRLRELKREKLFLHPSLYTIYLEYVGFKIVELQVSKKYKSRDRMSH